jgi:hypothetical protein
MQSQQSKHKAIRVRVNRLLSLLYSFAIVAVSTFAVTVNVFGDLSHPSRFTFELLAIMALHAVRYQRFWVSREIGLNLGFLGYTVLSLAWTIDSHKAMTTMPSIVNFSLVLILFSALMAFHDLGALLAGMFVGFLAAAAVYTLTSGFPFSYPEDFSYNTIAGMYLFGLFVTVVFGAYKRWTLMPMAVAPVLMVLIAATTSIKTNLGVALGITVATLCYFKLSAKDLIRTVAFLAIVAGAIVYGMKFNQTLSERVGNGFARVSTGLAVLTNREGDSGATGLGTRQGWTKEGLKGWAVTPVFGHGVEGFRADHGITSHSTPIDLLYNAGVIGCGLFYGMFASIAWRLLRAQDRRRRGLRARIVACLVAYAFISISGLIYYDPFVAIFVALSSGLLMRLERITQREVAHERLSIGASGGSVSSA